MPEYVPPRDVPAPRGFAAAGLDGRRRRWRLMLVSPDKQTRSAFEHAGRACGWFEVPVAFLDGRFALEWLSEIAARSEGAMPDIVMVDRASRGLGAAQLVRELRRYDGRRRVLIAIFAPDANPWVQDEFESAGADVVIRAAGLLLEQPGRFFAPLIQRAVARLDAPELAALNLLFGSLGGCGLEVPPLT